MSSEAGGGHSITYCFCRKLKGQYVRSSWNSMYVGIRNTRLLTLCTMFKSFVDTKCTYVTIMYIHIFRTIDIIKCAHVAQYVLLSLKASGLN